MTYMMISREDWLKGRDRPIGDPDERNERMETIYFALIVGWMVLSLSILIAGLIHIFG